MRAGGAMGVPRVIEGFERDDGGRWVASLDCGHRRHVLHRPPLSAYPWVEDAQQRAARVGTRIECDRCAQRLLPDEFEVYKQTATFDEESLPAGLRRAHRTRRGVWGRLCVHEGSAQLSFEAPVGDTVTLGAGDEALIPPEVPHAVTLRGAVRLHVEFLRRS